MTQAAHDYLVSVCKKAIEDPSLAGGDPSAVPLPLRLTCLTQAGAQIHVCGCSHAQVVCLCPAGCAQLGGVVHQALVHLALARLHSAAVLIYILSAGLCQDDIIPEVSHLWHAHV